MALCYEIKTDRHNQKFCEVTGYDGKVTYLTIPEEIDQFPVKSIAAGAFSGREDIQWVKLPQNMEVLRRNVFYNCMNLEEIQLFDGIEDYYDGVIKLCNQLKRIQVTIKRNDYSIVKELLQDYDRKIEIILQQEGQEEQRVFFPAYVYDFVEDVEARVLHHKIEGAGYPYRECVTRKGIDLLAYDRLFYKMAAEDLLTSMEIALARLLYPKELTTQAKKRYEDFLAENAERIVKELVEKYYIKALQYIFDRKLVPQDALPGLMLFAAEKKSTEAGAMLLAYEKDNFSTKPVNTGFDLDDW